MNYDQITGVIRAVLPPILTWFAAKGYIGVDAIAGIVSAVVAIGAALWSLKRNTAAAMADAVVVAAPGTTIKTTPEMAAATVSPKITS